MLCNLLVQPVMLEHSDYVVAYVTHTWGGAAKFVEKAKKKGKLVINLSDKEPLQFSI